MATLEQIKAPIQREFEDFQNTLNLALATDNPALRRITAHLRRGTGKRMRPILTLLSASACGGVTSATLHAAVSLELLHMASLMHDDIVDMSPVRHGQPSVAAAFSNTAAVLGGDFFLATSLLEAGRTDRLECVKALSSLGRCLSGGELLQMETSESDAFSESDYMRVITDKTASLFATCAYMGGITGQTPDDERTALLRQTGIDTGVIFQLRDDMFDYASEAETGKPAGHDLEEHKATLPLIYVYQQAGEEERRQIRDDFDHRRVKPLQERVRREGGLDYTAGRIQALTEACLERLSRLPANAFRDALEAYVRFAGERRV